MTADQEVPFEFSNYRIYFPLDFKRHAPAAAEYCLPMPPPVGILYSIFPGAIPIAELCR